jgi:DNA-binding CsgD family transcriptional regulator
MSLIPPEQNHNKKNAEFNDSFYGQPKPVLLDEKQWLYIQKRYSMSPRELEVAKLVCQGLTNEDMADKLKVRPGTVKTHLRSIFNKARVRNKISMLLRFVDDVNRFYQEAEGVAPIPIVDREKTAPKAPAPHEIPEKE